MNNDEVSNESAAVATPEMTRAALLTETQERRRTAIRTGFLQDRDGDRAAGPLHLFVTGRRRTALHLYLMLHCVASGGEFDSALPAMVWARALCKTKTSAEASISRNWSWLESQKLVRSASEDEKKERLRRVYLLAENGSGEPYTHPTNQFFYFPFAFFTDGWSDKLSLAATAVLLIALDQKPTFRLAKERASGYYDISADTLQRGVDELRDEGLLHIEQRRIAAPKLRQGWTLVNE